MQQLVIYFFDSPYSIDILVNMDCDNTLLEFKKFLI